MICAEYKTRIIEGARSGNASTVRRHLDACDSCRAFFEEQAALSEALRSLPEELVPFEVELALLKEFESAWPGRRSARRWLWIPVAAAAAVLLAVMVSPKPKPVPVRMTVGAVEKPKLPPVASARPDQSETGHHVAVVQRLRKTPQEDTAPFISIPYTTPLAPYERAQVMQVEMPVAELIAAGLPVATSDPGAQARADVIVGDDGRARAVRVVSIFERSMEQ